MPSRPCGVCLAAASCLHPLCEKAATTLHIANGQFWHLRDRIMMSKGVGCHGQYCNDDGEGLQEHECCTGALGRHQERMRGNLRRVGTQYVAERVMQYQCVLRLCYADSSPVAFDEVFGGRDLCNLHVRADVSHAIVSLDVKRFSRRQHLKHVLTSPQHASSTSRHHHRTCSTS